MTAKYTMQEMNNLQKEGETLLYPRMLIQNCCETDELVRKIAGETTFSTGEIRGIISLLAQKMAWEMANGNSVKLDEIGIFTPALTLKKGKEREKAEENETRRNATSIEVGDVNFRPAKELVRETNLHCHLERETKRNGLHTSEYTPEQRLEMARQYLRTHPAMTVGEYAALTGLSRTTASRELRRWNEMYKDEIGIKGKGSHRIYVKPTGDNR